jgi:hypothetical protein
MWYIPDKKVNMDFDIKIITNGIPPIRQFIELFNQTHKQCAHSMEEYDGCQSILTKTNPIVTFSFLQHS